MGLRQVLLPSGLGPNVPCIRLGHKVVPRCLVYGGVWQGIIGLDLRPHHGHRSKQLFSVMVRIIGWDHPVGGCRSSFRRYAARVAAG